jgi:pimeloyl-ACP methyl ester carboxylesterase
MLLLLGDGTQVPVTELPGDGPWTFLVLQPEAPGAAAPDPGSVAAGQRPAEPGPGPDAGLAGPEPGAVARALTRFGRAVVPDLRARPGWGARPGGPGLLDLVDDLDQVRTRAGLGRPVLVGLDDLAPLALRAAADQPWAWRALLVTGPADLPRLEVPALALDADPAPAVEELLSRLGPGPGWAGIAPDAPPR